jgi:phage repressor protein C with HTH and peptisase S24 domain
MVLSERLSAQMHEKRISQAELARRVGVTQQTIGKLIKGLSSGSSHIHKIARELGTTPEYLTGEIDDPTPQSFASDRTSYRVAPNSLNDLKSAGDMVPVMMIDLSYGMGMTFLDVPVDEQIRYFPREFLRTYTKSAPEFLFWAHGIGDSMSPDINDTDTLLIDTNQKNLNIADKIWALAWGEVGMVKRLRPMPDGSVEIISSNPNVPAARAVDGEMDVIGRVVAVVRKI